MINQETLPHIAKDLKKSFWAYAKCTNSLDRYAPGVKLVRLKFDLLFGNKKFIRLRYYTGPDGERRRTAEIEI